MANNFQDVEYTKVDLDSPKVDVLDDVESDEADETDESKPLDESSSDEKPSLLTMAYYQRFFNVDTRQVAFRLLGSFVPRPGRNLVIDDIRHSPDLYGPFWVTTTLVFASAVAGNLVNYLQAGTGSDWVYDFSKVTVSATGIYLYWWLLPFTLWLITWWRQLPEKYKFLELLCLFGYSLTVYVPAFVLCAIPFDSVRWPLVMSAMLLSGVTLAVSLWPALASDGVKQGAAVLAVVLLLHVALALWFKLYFFPDSSAPANSPVTSAPANTTSAP